MRIAVTGKDGQVAQALARLAPAMDADVILVGRPDLDLANPETVLPALSAARPDAIVSAAAYTAVDKAEGDRDLAFAVNGVGAGAVATAAEVLGVPLLHLSTDYVFDGTKTSPYIETDATGPISVYGASKLDGERRIAEATRNAAIFRTAWVYSAGGANFLKTMLRLGETRDSVSVVADQIGCPTAADDIACALITAAKAMARDKDPKYRGIFHLTGSGEASWAAFAEEIFAAAAANGRPQVSVVPISSDAFPSVVRRPANSRLSGAKLAEIYGIALPDWKRSTRKVVDELLGQSETTAA